MKSSISAPAFRSVSGGISRIHSGGSGGPYLSTMGLDQFTDVSLTPPRSVERALVFQPPPPALVSPPAFRFPRPLPPLVASETPTDIRPPLSRARPRQVQLKLPRLSQRRPRITKHDSRITRISITTPPLTARSAAARRLKQTPAASRSTSSHAPGPPMLSPSTRRHGPARSGPRQTARLPMRSPRA